MEVDAGSNQGADRRDGKGPGTTAASAVEEIIGFANGDFVEGVVGVDLEFAERSVAHTGRHDASEVQGIEAVAAQRFESDIPGELV
jgi:hypothetical protein